MSEFNSGDMVRWDSFVCRLIEPCIDDGVPEMCRFEEHDGVPMQVWRVFNVTTNRETFACSHEMVRFSGP